MDIALLNVRISFLKNIVTVDEIGNHRNTWTEQYSCYATVSTDGSSKSGTIDALGSVEENGSLAFTVRYCDTAAAFRADNARIQFRNEFYDIVSVDYMNYKRKAIKFRCQKVRR